MTGLIQSFDDALLGLIQSNIRCDFLDMAMPFITRLGDNGFIWLLVALVFMCIKKYRAYGISMLLALSLGLLVGNLGLKLLIARARPFTVDPTVTLLIPAPSGYSFPSAHAMSSFASATVIFNWNWRMGILAGILASAIAFSRLYLYVHYPSDVFGGLVIGVVLGMLTVFIHNRGTNGVNKSRIG